MRRTTIQITASIPTSYAWGRSAAELGADALEHAEIPIEYLTATWIVDGRPNSQPYGDAPSFEQQIDDDATTPAWPNTLELRLTASAWQEHAARYQLGASVTFIAHGRANHGTITRGQLEDDGGATITITTRVTTTPA